MSLQISWRRGTGKTRTSNFSALLERTRESRRHSLTFGARRELERIEEVAAIGNDRPPARVMRPHLC